MNNFENNIEQNIGDKLSNLAEKSEIFTKVNYDCYSFSEKLSDDGESLNEEGKNFCESLNVFFASKNPEFLENLENTNILTLN